jgi:hypothetical protein
MDRRVSELLALAEAEGLRLPYAPELIVRLEDAGHVVDLHSGAILLGEGARPYHWHWTPVGEAWAHLVRLGLADPVEPGALDATEVDA